MFVNSTLSFSLIVLVYVVLGLLEVGVFANRLKAMSNQDVGQALLSGIIEIAAKLRRYMAVRSLMSVATGFLVWVFASTLGRHNAGHGGSSMRIARVLIMSEPPSIDANEVTDKGYINQRATLERRSALVAHLYADPIPDDVIVIE